MSLDCGAEAGQFSARRFSQRRVQGIGHGHLCPQKPRVTRCARCSGCGWLWAQAPTGAQRASYRTAGTSVFTALYDML